jgi:hypothetical protein
MYLKFVLLLLWSHHVEYNISHNTPKLSYLNRMQTQVVLKANKHICVRINVNITVSVSGGRHTG